MEYRLANSWNMTVNEKKFIETAILSDIRVDGRRPFDYRRLVIEFGREDGSSEVQLGQTRVMGFVTAQLTQPYRDRPNEGSLAIFTEFSPMADPSFEIGRPGESAVELGRIVDRGLRESRAVDTESLCVLSGKLVWAVRIDLHILDNGGNLVDAANIAALAALLTFRRPECTLGGEDGQEVILHPPEVREPLPLIIHHLPIAVTFAFFSDTVVMIDPSQLEEAVMGGRMTTTLNTSGDICAIQKPGGLGVMNSVVMQCLRIASVKASDITSKIKSAVESYNLKRAHSKIKRHPISQAGNVGVPAVVKEENDKIVDQKAGTKGNDMEVDAPSQELSKSDGRDCKAESSMRGPSNWDPCSEGVKPDVLKASLASHDSSSKSTEQQQRVTDNTDDGLSDAAADLNDSSSVLTEVAMMDTDNMNSLEDAVKTPKSKRKKKKKGAAKVETN